MMTLSNGNGFRVTGSLWGNPAVTGGFPSQKASNTSFDVFFDVSPNKRLNIQWSRWWFEMQWCSLWRHWNGIGDIPANHNDIFSLLSANISTHSMYQQLYTWYGLVLFCFIKQWLWPAYKPIKYTHVCFFYLFCCGYVIGYRCLGWLIYTSTA